MPRLSGMRRGGDDSAHFAGVDCLTNFSGLDVDGAEQARASVVRDDVAGRFISDCDAGDPERNHRCRSATGIAREYQYAFES